MRAANPWTAVLCAAILVMPMASSPALGQDQAARQAGREREMLRRVQEQQRQSEEARARAEAENAKLEGQLQDVQKKAKAVEAGVVQERRRTGELQRRLDALTREHATLDQERQALAEKLRVTREQLDQATAELARRQDALAARASEIATLTESGSRRAADLAVCEDKNAQLAGVAGELMAKYRDVGFWDALSRKEPFTGIRRVQVENLLEDARDRVEAARIAPAR